MTILLISNRVAEPARNGAIAGGLAAALGAAVRDSGATWIGGSGKTAPDSVEFGPGDALPANTKALGAGTLVTLDFPAQHYRHFYDGMANSALWPILHYRADLIRYESAFLAAYCAINRAMADSVSRLAQDDSLIWVHDYHFFLLGKYLREREVTGPIGFFLHTSFPPRSVMMCLPCHRELMESLSAYDVIGFQTDDDLLRFRDYATNELFATPAGRTDLRFGERRVRLGVFPIGIDVERFSEAAEKASHSRGLMRLRQALPDSRLVIGVDRLDYSKGLLQRFSAYQQFLTFYPDERKRVSFLQITPPTRSKVDAYRHMRAELASIAGDINARHGDADWVALRYINEGFSPDRLAGYYRLAKIGCVTPLRDGMNLVAKEYVASQDPDDPGVLVLSIFAGAAKQLSAALLVNPYDPEAMAHRLHDALYMPKEERIERWAAMMRTLRGADLATWFSSFVAALRLASAKAAPFVGRSVA